MWKSPITKVINDIETKLVQEEENRIVMEISESLGYHIDTEELLKALSYSKEQYDKGYAEGRNDADIRIQQALDEITEEGAYFHEIAGNTEYVKGISFCIDVLNKHLGKEES